jgi:hypothetical protein
MDANNPLVSKPSRPNQFTVAADSPRGQALAAWSFPNDNAARERLDAIAQTPDDNGKVLCWRRRRQCTNKECCDPNTLAPHQFTKAERDLWNCPICGRDRHCRRLVRLPNRGCYQHGGKTPNGWDLPQTKSGEHSKHLRLGPMRADYERLLASDQLHSVDDSIALLKAHLNEIVAQYGDGISRKFLKEMEQNRAEYKKQLRLQKPDPVELRRLDQDLDAMIAEGSRAYAISKDFRDTAHRISKLIADHDRHVQMERSIITADKAWVMLSHIDETFRVGAELIVDVVDEKFVKCQCDILGVDFSTLSPERVQELKQLYNKERQKEKRKLLAYASNRFGELAESGIVPRPRRS